MYYINLQFLKTFNMKSLSQLKINSAKMLNNEELINLKGGVESDNIGYCGPGCTGYCHDAAGNRGNCGYTNNVCTCIFE